MYQFTEIIFWLSAFALLYTYLGYPFLVYLVAQMFPKIVNRAPYEPIVTILITAYNEEKDIRGKIENTLALDYPIDKLEIIVASDGSTDATDPIVKEFEAKGVKLFRQEGRVGKTDTQNNAIKQAAGEVVVFSDATTLYHSNVLRAMMPNFSDPTIGCVAGKLVYVDDANSGVGAGAKSYWSYETFLKKNESRGCSLIGVSGCMYAVRKSAYRPMYPEACSDFLICSVLYRQGLRTVYEPTAICTEETNHRADREFQMRVRIISQTLTDLWRNRDIMNPLSHGLFSLQLISHKMARYAVPVFLVMTLISSLYLATDSTFFKIIFGIQVIFYLSALLGLISRRESSGNRIYAIPFYFVLGNIAIVRGVIEFLKGERYQRWEPFRTSV